jgi:hypothetical protein
MEWRDAMRDGILRYLAVGKPWILWEEGSSCAALKTGGAGKLKTRIYKWYENSNDNLLFAAVFDRA